MQSSTRTGRRAADLPASADRESRLGPRGASLAPPGSGIDFIDHGFSPVQCRLPDGLRAGLESLSGISLEGVRVHRNSSKPTHFQAHAYAQGDDIHLAPNQERHLPHEAWHVVQQRQGRVVPTVRIAGAGVNDDAGLEREAESMGARAASAAVRTTTRRLMPGDRATGNVAQLNGDEKARGDAQRKRAHAQATIAYVSQHFDDKIAGHIFDGKPADGGAVDKNVPTGLHAYRDRALPQGVQHVVTSGSATKKHNITWSWNGTAPKGSTMFPNWISEPKLKTLIGLKYPDWVEGGLPDPAYPDETRTHILGGHSLTFSKHGDTVYPD